MNTIENTSPLDLLFDKLDRSTYKSLVFTVLSKENNKARLYELNKNSSDTIPIDILMPDSLSFEKRDLILAGGYYFGNENYILERYINLTSNRSIVENHTGFFNKDTFSQIRWFYHSLSTFFIPLIGIIYIIYLGYNSNLTFKTSNKFHNVKFSLNLKEWSVAIMIQVLFIFLLYIFGISVIWFGMIPISIIIIILREIALQKITKKLKEYENDFCDLYTKSINEYQNIGDIEAEAKVVYSRFNPLSGLELSIDKVIAKELKANDINAESLDANKVTSKTVASDTAQLYSINAESLETNNVTSKTVASDTAQIANLTSKSLDTKKIISKCVRSGNTKLSNIDAESIKTNNFSLKEMKITNSSNEDESYNAKTPNESQKEYLDENKTLGITLNAIADYINSSKYPQKTIAKRYYKRFYKKQTVATLIGETIDLNSDNKQKQNVYNFDEVVIVLCMYLKEIKSENSCHNNLTEGLLREALKPLATNRYKAL